MHADDRSSWTCDQTVATQVRLQVRVSHLSSGRGSINVTIYPDDARHFLDGKYKLYRIAVPVRRPETTFCLALPAVGDYAVALFQDENDNGHLDTNFFGLPTEPYGFSRNPTLYLGPPDLDQVRIHVTAGDNPVAIRLSD